LPFALLLEAGFWGLAYGTLAREAKDIGPAVNELLIRERLSSTRIKIWISANRVAIVVEGLPENQPGVNTEVRGPKAALAYDFNRLPTQAAIGFASAQGVELKDLIIKELDGEKFLFAKRLEKGKSLADIISKTAGQIFSLFPWTSQPWTPGMIFPQPPAHICALLDDKLLNITIDGVLSGRETSIREGSLPKKINIPHALEYQRILSDLEVQALPADRQKLIESQFQAIAGTGATIRKDKNIIEKITFEVERPHPVNFSLPPETVNLPTPIFLQILTASPAYLPFESTKGVFLPQVVGFIDKRHIGSNEPELRATELLKRFSQISQLWFEELKRPFEERAADLRFITNSEGTASLYEDALRISRRAHRINDLLNLGSNEELIDKCVMIYFSEKSSKLLKYYPDLAGTLAMLSAETQGLSPDFIAGLKDLWATFPGREGIPTSPLGIAVTLSIWFDRLFYSAINRDVAVDRILNILLSKQFGIDIFKTADISSPVEKIDVTQWIEIIIKRMTKESLDRKKMDWISELSEFNPVAVISTLKLFPDGPPKEAEILASLFEKIENQIAGGSTSGATFAGENTDVPFENTPSKGSVSLPNGLTSGGNTTIASAYTSGLESKIREIESLQAVDMKTLFEKLLDSRSEIDAVLSDIAKKPIVNAENIPNTIHLIKRLSGVMARLPFIHFKKKSLPKEDTAV